MRPINKIFTCILLCTGVTLTAQGQSAAFLNITPDARSAAMGSAGLALSNSPFSIFHQTAGIAFSEQNTSIGYSYTPWMRELVDGSNMHTVGGYYKLGKKQGIALGMRYFSGAEYDVSDAQGNPSGSFQPKEWALDLGYALAVTDRIALSLTARYISSDMGDYNGAKKGSAFAADISAIYKEKDWSVALAVANIGSKIDYGFSKYELPGMLKLGGMYEWHIAQKHQLTGSVELDYQLFPSDYSGIAGGIGAEYLYNHLIAVRAGYHLGDEEKTGYNYFSAGCGVQCYGVMLDFSYWMAASDCPLKNTFQLSLGWNF